ARVSRGQQGRAEDARGHGREPNTIDANALRRSNAAFFSGLAYRAAVSSGADMAAPSTAAAPQVFISYTHDSPDHMLKVRELSEKLRNLGGVDCRIDQQIESPPEGWPKWCKPQIRDARFVFVVCTAIYLRRYEGDDEFGTGRGGKWEGRVITQQIYEA